MKPEAKEMNEMFNERYIRIKFLFCIMSRSLQFLVMIDIQDGC